MGTRRRGGHAPWAVFVAVVLAVPSTVLARAGMLDPSFGTGGLAIVPGDPLTPEYYVGVAVRSDGRIVVVGEGSPFTGSAKVMVARYLHDGTLDPTFGTGGIAAP